LQAQAALRRQSSAPLPRRVRLAKRSYVGCWCALDDVSEENGTVYNLPYALAGTKDKIKHVKDEATNDMVGYFGSEPGTPVIAPAGSIAVFSSTCFHRNGFNRTDKVRRAYLVQYSNAPILTEDGSAPRHLTEPFLRDGRNVARI
jgi:ectoine hydroxylase-related dioxygenase (phytanoyl-CoA dioxygenase family)